MSIYVHGIKIYLIDEYTQNTDIGLYTSGGVSWLRWSEVELTGASETYKCGMLVPGGIPPIDEGGDFRRGGGFVAVKGMTVTIKNTAKFWKSLDDAGIGINGRRADIVEFTINPATGAVSAESTIGYFKTSVSKWHIGTYEIPLEPAVYNRNAPMATETTVDDSGENVVIPCTFGHHSSTPASIVNTKNIETVQSADAIVRKIRDISGLSMGTLCTRFVQNGVLDDRMAFPVIANSGTTGKLYSIALDTASNPVLQFNTAGWTVDVDISDEDWYIRVIKDANGNTGRMIKISTISPFSFSGITLTPEAHFPLVLDYNSIAGGAWVDIVKIQKEYKPDVWPMYYVDKSGNNPDIYARKTKLTVTVAAIDVETPVIESRPDTGVYYRIPDISSEINPDYNLITLNPIMFNGNIGSVESYVMLPANSVAVCDESMGDWAITNWQRRGDGLYMSMAAFGQPIPAESFPFAVSDLNSYELTRDGNSYAELRMTCLYSGGAEYLRYGFGIIIYPPNLPDNLEFDSVHLLLRASSYHSTPYAIWDDSACVLAWRRWIGSRAHIFTNEHGIDYQVTRPEPATPNFNNVPDKYYTTNAPTTDDFRFYREGAFPESWQEIYGINNFKLQDIGGKEQYKEIDKCLFWIDSAFAYGENEYQTLKLYTVGFAFHGTYSLSNIYVACRGRIFDDTWGARKTAASMIENPVDMYEHACRLQNWSEAGTEAIEYGKGYSANALIDTSTTGFSGLDSLQLADVKDRRFAFQIMDYDPSWTKEFKENMLRAMWCVGHVNEEGKECLSYLPKIPTTAPSDTITLGSVPEGMEVGDVEEPRPEDIFCEPFIRYGWDEGAQKFNGLVGIKQVHRAAWASTYTPGFTAGDGEFFWQLCHDELWGRYHQIENPPSDLTDQKFISTEADAKWFLTNWIYWMILRRIEIPVYYDLAKTWHVGRHLYLQLPHQTNNTQKEAVIERVVKNKNGGYCTLSLAFWAEEFADYYYKERTYTAAQGADVDWKDTTDVANPNYKNQI